MSLVMLAVGVLVFEVYVAAISFKDAQTMTMPGICSGPAHKETTFYGQVFCNNPTNNRQSLS